MKKSNDAIGNRTRDLPACSAVLQPTAPPCAPVTTVHVLNVHLIYLGVTFGGLCHVGKLLQKYIDSEKHWLY